MTQRSRWLLLILVPAIAMPFVHAEYWTTIAATIAIDGIAAVGLAVTLQKAGQPSLAQASFMAIGAYTTGLLETTYHMPLPLAALAGVAAATLTAYVVGAVLLELEGLYFALGTLAFVSAVVAILTNAPWFGQAVGITGLTRLRVGSLSVEDSVATLAWTLLFGVLVIAQRIDDSRLGRGMRMLRESLRVTRSVGMNPASLKRLAFALSGAFGGLAGSLITMLYGIVNPQLFSLATSITLVSMVIVGGDALWAAVVGAIVMVGFGEIVRGQLEFAPVSMIGGIDLILNGAVLLLIMRFWPAGVAGLETLVPRRPIARVKERSTARISLAGMGIRAVAEAGSRGAILRATDVSHRFGGVAAVTGVSLSVSAGEVLAVVGPNGAGKTTLLGILGGFHELQRGRIELADSDVSALSADRRARLGVAATFQHMEVVERMSVEENVLAAGTRHDAAQSAVLTVGLEDCARLPVAALSFGQQRMVELARAIARPSLPAVLLMDVPASGLSAQERTLLADVIRYFSRSGTAVVLVEHDVAFVARLADRMLVLDHGIPIAEGAPDTVLRAPNVVEAYIGKATVAL